MIRYAILVLVSFCSCHAIENVDRIYPTTTTSERIEERYARPSADTPESLRPFYDPGLTQALNR